MIKFPQRSFYFAQLAPINKNIDFPLNLGYNDHPKTPKPRVLILIHKIKI